MPETMTRSTTARIRFPVEFLTVVDEWATAHEMPRSVAVRALVLRGMAWEKARQSKCDCDGTDQCTKEGDSR
jgi:hypothetical protein